MMIRISILIVFLLGLTCAFPKTALAHPKHATFEQMIEGKRHDCRGKVSRRFA